MIRVIQFIHWIVLIFMIFGWLSPWQKMLVTHAIAIPLVVLHWKTNRNRCILTEIEDRLKHGDSGQVKSENRFVKTIWMKITGHEPTEAFLYAVIYSVLSVSLLITLSRLYLWD